MPSDHLYWEKYKFILHSFQVPRQNRKSSIWKMTCEFQYPSLSEDLLPKLITSSICGVQMLLNNHESLPALRSRCLLSADLVRKWWVPVASICPLSRDGTEEVFAEGIACKKLSSRRAAVKCGLTPFKESSWYHNNSYNGTPYASISAYHNKKARCQASATTIFR